MGLTLRGRISRCDQTCMPPDSSGPTVAMRAPLELRYPRGAMHVAPSPTTGSSPDRSYALRAAPTFALAALLALALVARADALADPFMALSAALSGALVGAALWHLLARGSASLRRGALVGAAAGLVTHLPFWLLYTLSKMARGSEAWSLKTLLGAPLLLGLMGAALTSWITAPVGAAAGALLARWQRQARG